MSPSPVPVRPHPATVDFGRPTLVTRGPRWSLRLDVRTAVSCAVFLLLTLAAV
ncbi:iron-enterobactin ABC transporter permease, partial [Streptomyces sp. SID7499]|nr:iron-enterobactin ABC transporter permease [Streptomyces sp. SID7499]